MIGPNPTLTPAQVMRQTSLARGWHRITIGRKSIQVTASNLKAALEVAYDPASPEWLDRIGYCRCDDADYLCVDDQLIRQGFIL
jgi:hypothetical protein